MDQGPLVGEQIRVGADLVNELHKAMPLRAAYWLKQGDEERTWQLHLAIENLEQVDLGKVLLEIRRILGDGPYVWVNPMFDVNIVDVTDLKAMEIIERQERYTHFVGSRIGPCLIGGEYVESGYVYPIPAPTPA